MPCKVYALVPGIRMWLSLGVCVWGGVFCLLQSHNEIGTLRLPISESAQGFSENPDSTLASTFILVGVPPGLCFNRQLFLGVRNRNYFAS